MWWLPPQRLSPPTRSSATRPAPRRSPCWCWRRLRQSRSPNSLRPPGVRGPGPPGIGLRIPTLSRSTTVLAEGGIPSAKSVPPAKVYRHKELEQLAVLAARRRLPWDEGADKLVVRLANSPAVHTTSIPLE